MIADSEKVQKWLSNEDKVCYEDRLKRLTWIAQRMPPGEYIAFIGGGMAHYLFEETRYCFVYGQFLASIVLGLGFIEHSLASSFYTAGRDDLERASIKKLLHEAFANNWISENELKSLERARKIRNPITHFRKPGYKDTIEWRVVNVQDHPYKIIEEDAYHVMETIFHLMSTNLLCWIV